MVFWGKKIEPDGDVVMVLLAGGDTDTYGRILDILTLFESFSPAR